MHRKIPPKDVTLGMYIQGFGGSWFDHPFWKARFEVRTERQLERIRQAYIPFVVIDDERGLAPPDEKTRDTPRQVSAPQQRIAPKGLAEPVKLRDLAKCRNSRRENDLARARSLVNRSAKVMRGVLDDARLGRAVKFDTVTSVTEDIVAGVERAPKTMLAVLRASEKDEYTYFHSVAVCTLMANFALHRGFDENAIRDYGLAGLLHDIGKAGVPDEILNKNGRLSEDEFKMVRTHPEFGFSILLEADDDIPSAAFDVCRFHHEKIDGTGYPVGLSGTKIPEAARMGAICDVYDALTSDRAYKQAWTPARALAEMWSWEGHFDRDLLFAFMQSIAIFPPGILVELRSKRLGLVLENGRRNSRPRVLSFYDTRNRAFIPPEELVITGDKREDGIIGPAEAQDWKLNDYDLTSEDAIRRLSTQRAA